MTNEDARRYISAIPAKYRRAVEDEYIRHLNAGKTVARAIHYSRQYMQRIMRDDGAPPLYLKAAMMATENAIGATPRKRSTRKKTPRKKVAKRGVKRRVSAEEAAERIAKKARRKFATIAKKASQKEAAERIAKKARRKFAAIAKKAAKKVRKKTAKKAIAKRTKRTTDITVSPKEILKTAKKSVKFGGRHPISKIRKEVGFVPRDYTMTSAQKIVTSARKHGQRAWVCAGKRYSGCGGGASGGHVVGRFS
jgi:hypothetical protein